MSKIVVTGAAGFIGSCLVGKLNNKGYKDIVLVDDFTHPEKENNYIHKAYLEKVNRDHFIAWLEDHAPEMEFVFHIGARTDTTGQDRAVFDKLNLNYSKSVWNACARHDIRLIYASSAATYGMGELGYEDE